MSKIIPEQIFINSQEIAGVRFNEMPATEGGVQVFAKNNKRQGGGKSLVRPNSYRGASRKNTSFFDTALGGEIGLAIVGYMLHQPHYTAYQIRNLIIADFGSVIQVDGIEKHMPHIRNFERWIKNFEEEISNLLTCITNPNAFKNYIKLTGADIKSHIKYLNQKREIDASPTDVFATEERRNQLSAHLLALSKKEY